MTKLTMVVLAVALGAGTARAQGELHGPILLELPASTRALALGGAYVSADADAGALFYNPALLESARGVGVSYQRWGEESGLGQVAAAMELAPGGLGVGVRFLSHEAPADALVAVPSDEARLFGGGGAPSSSLVAALGYARAVKGVRLGVAGKYVQEQVAGGRAAGVTVDAGAVMRVGPAVVGLAARNLFGELEPAPGHRYRFPRRVSLHASHPSKAVGPLDLVTTAAVSAGAGGEVVPAAGLELAYWPVVGKTFVGRLGVRRPVDGADPVTLGGAFIGDRFALEYAYGRFDGGEGTHRIGVRWRER